MSNAPTIHTVQPEDAAQLAQLHRESFGEAAWNFEQIKSSLALQTSLGWMICVDQKPAGFLLCQYIPAQSEILTFCVRPTLQRRGFGSLLLRQTLATLREKQCPKLFLEVAADNTAACTLYEKCGFQLVGRRRHYYRRNGQAIDALTYTLDLFASPPAP